MAPARKKRGGRKVKHEEKGFITSIATSLSPSPIIRPVPTKSDDTEEGSTTDINVVGGPTGLDDFLPPQNQAARTSPSHRIKEANNTSKLVLSPVFVSSSRGGRRGKPVSSREHEAAERAAREATSGKLRPDVAHSKVRVII